MAGKNQERGSGWSVAEDAESYRRTAQWSSRGSISGGSVEASLEAGDDSAEKPSSVK